MKIHGNPTKRYRLNYWGQFLDLYDTAKEALAGYKNHETLIRPVTDPKKKGRYSIYDGRDKEITVADLARMAAAEK